MELDGAMRAEKDGAELRREMDGEDWRREIEACASLKRYELHDERKESVKVKDRVKLG